MVQRWTDLLFLHWSYDPDEIQATLPDGLQVDTFDSRAYLGVVPFFMRDVRPRALPPVPGISNFLELNLRTYVYDRRGLPGVWFYSLDANQWLAVKIARILFNLPYFYADMRADKNLDGEIRFTSRRRGVSPERLSTFRYRGLGPSRVASPGSLAFFLTERYLLFSHSPKTGALSYGQVHHEPYPLLQAEVPAWDDALFRLNGFVPPRRGPDHILMSPGVHVEVFGLKTIHLTR
jgi:uncharacterized protein YqjF (DUF2071 family)